MTHDWDAVGEAIGVPHHGASWAHLLLVNSFLLIWHMTSYLNGIPTLFYWVNLVIYPIVCFLDIVGIICFSAWCRSKRRESAGGADATAINAARIGDRFSYSVGFVLSFALTAFVVFVFALPTGMLSDATVAMHNITNDTVIDAQLVEYFEFSQDTDLLGMIVALLRFVAFLAVMLTYGSNVASYLAINANLPLGEDAAENTSSMVMTAPAKLSKKQQQNKSDSLVEGALATLSTRA